MKRPDLGDGAVVGLAAAAALLIAVYFLIVQPALPEAWRMPGSPELYVVGVVGAFLLLVPMAFALIKRGGGAGRAPAWFVAHVICSSLGTVLVVIHSAGYLRRPPALLILALLGLILLGVRGRVGVSRQMADTLGAKQRGFAAVGEVDRTRLAAVIGEKRALLPALDASAREATFSPTLAHWFVAPLAAWRYARLAREESRLIGARASVGREQAWWRPLHLVLAYVFVSGLVVHVITVTFFAGYVADGGPITWWHLADW